MATPSSPSQSQPSDSAEARSEHPSHPALDSVPGPSLGLGEQNSRLPPVTPGPGMD